MYISKIHRSNTTSCQKTNEILKIIYTGISNIDSLTNENNKEIYYNELKSTISSCEDKLSEKNPIKIELVLQKILKSRKKQDHESHSEFYEIEKIPTSYLKKIRTNKCLYFSFELNDLKKLEKELDKENLFFVRSSKDIYTIIEKIGNGGNGDVFLSQNSHGRSFAIKIFRNASQKRKDSFIKEANFLLVNNNNNIVKVYDIQTSSNEVLFYVMERFEQNLEEYLGLDIENKDYKPKIKKSDYLMVLEVLLNVVKDLESQGLYHTDIKLENILVNSNSKGNIFRIVLADFGCLGPKIRKSDDVVGNIEFKAPEAFGVGEIDVSKHDIYSLGMIFNKMITGERPVGENYKQIGMINNWKDLVFIDYIISFMLEQKTSNRPCINDSIKLFNLFQDLLKFDSEKFNKVNKINGSEKIKIYLDFPLSNCVVVNDLRFKNKFGFNIESLKTKIGKNLLHIVEGHDATNYKNNCLKIMDCPFILESFYDENIECIKLYHMGSFIMILKKYEKTESISFYNKDNIKRDYNFFNDQKAHDNEIFFDPNGLNGVKSCNKFIVFNSKYLPLNCRIKFILGYNRPILSNPSKELIKNGITVPKYYDGNFHLYFLFNDVVFPLNVTSETIKIIKRELKLL